MDISVEFISVPFAFSSPWMAGCLGTFSGAGLCVVDREIETLDYDLSFAWGTWKVAGDEQRKLLLGRVIESAMLSLDLTLAPERFRFEVQQAAALLKAGLSQIAPDPEGGSLTGYGIHRFFNVKLHWQSKNPFPYHLFRWRGLDGSEVTAHIPDLQQMYNGRVIECNLAEADADTAVSQSGGSFRFEIRPFQIRTFSLLLEEKR